MNDATSEVPTYLVARTRLSGIPVQPSNKAHTLHLSSPALPDDAWILYKLMIYNAYFYSCSVLLDNPQLASYLL